MCKGDTIFSAIEKISELDIAQPRAVKKKKHDHAKKWHIALAVFAVIALNLGALYLYRRHAKKKMDAELRF